MRSASSAVNTVISYATFFTLSVVLHLVVILGTRPAAKAEAPAQADRPAVTRPGGKRHPQRRASADEARTAARLDRAAASQPPVGGGLE